MIGLECHDKKRHFSLSIAVFNDKVELLPEACNDKGVSLLVLGWTLSTAFQKSSLSWGGPVASSLGEVEAVEEQAGPLWAQGSALELEQFPRLQLPRSGLVQELKEKFLCRKKYYHWTMYEHKSSVTDWASDLGFQQEKDVLAFLVFKIKDEGG